MHEEITVLDLFSGIGGFSLGLERAGPFRTVAFCEQDAYAQRVLKKHWPDTPIFEDVRTIDTDGLGRIDFIRGGFPCLPLSVAGQQRGAEDDRDLWPAMVALVEELRPKFLIGENVRGFVNEPMGLNRSLSDLARIGYSAVTFVIPACAVDAPHRRDRVWIIAAQDGSDADGQRPHRAHKHVNRSGQSADGQERESGSVCEVLAGSGNTGKRRPAPSSHADGQSEPDGTQHEKRILADADNADGRRGAQRQQSGNGKSALHGEVGATVADATSEGLEGRQKPETTRQPLAAPAISGKHREDVANASAGRRASQKTEVPTRGNGTEHQNWWLPEPDVGRVANGIPSRVDRLRCLGNAVVPQVVEQIGKAILESQKQ